MAHLAIDALECAIGFFFGRVEVKAIQTLYVTCGIAFGIVYFVVPTTRIGASALVRVAVVEITRQ